MPFVLAFVVVVIGFNRKMSPMSYPKLWRFAAIFILQNIEQLELNIREPCIISWYMQHAQILLFIFLQNLN